MSSETAEISRKSFNRCAESADFFQAFYRNLFKVLPAAEPLFAKTDLVRQGKLLEHAIKILHLFPLQPPGEPTLLTRLAKKHGKDELAIDPSWYPIFFDTLIVTASQFDPDFSSEVERAWRETLRPGFDYMRHWDRDLGST